MVPTNDCLRALLELKALEKLCPSGCFWLASEYALAGKPDKAMQLLERAYQERDPAMPQLKSRLRLAAPRSALSGSLAPREFRAVNVVAS